MADIRLARPAAGASESVACSPEARFVFDFPTDEATLARNGDNLTITFSDGASLNLEGFYEEYNKESLPSFTIDGMEVAAADFFNAMNEPDLMPAAGPAAGATPAGGRFHQYDSMDLADGIDHLNGLDWGMNRPPVEEIARGAVGERGGDEGERLFAATEGQPVEPPVDHPVNVTPENPGELPPNTPETDTPGMDLPRDILHVKEEDLSSGNGAVAVGAMDISAPDGVATITIGGVTVWENGALVPNAEIATDEGKLTVTGFNPATGRLEYSYKLTQATQEHQGEGRDNIAHNLTVTVTDSDGDSASSVITVVIQDDMPEITNMTQDPGKDISCKTPVLDFTNNQGEPTSSITDFVNKFGWDNATSSRPDDRPDDVHVGFVGGYKIIPTFVQYTFDGSGNLNADNLVDWYENIYLSDVDNGSGMDSKNDALFHKVLQLTQDGLSVGGKWGFGEVSGGEDGRHDINSNSHQEGFGDENTPHQSEAIVLENENNSVSYGMDIQLGRFDGDDTVLICFYLTPRNNNDNDLVKMVEVKASDVVDGKISIDVPDGFNKVIVAPVVGKDADGNVTGSDFTIKNLSFTKPAWEHSGEVVVTEGADGLTDAGVTWNWSESGLNNATVQVVGTLGGGEYTVELVFDGTTVKAVLHGNADAEINLNGNILFEGRLNSATGEWTINQFYKFVTADGKENAIDVKFSATDADGDTVTSTLPVNLHLEQGLDRFDNVETGTWDPAWGSNAALDHASDYLAGGEGNDLIFGRGGNDLLFGDGGDDILSALKGHLGLNPTYGEGNFVRFQEGILGGNINWGDGVIKPETINSREEILQKFNGLEAALETGQTMGDDALFGGNDQDMLFGMGGHDYLDGGEGKDILSGGSGNDILVYDADDYVVHGGSGVDLLLGGKGTPDLDKLLTEGDGKNGMPIVAEIEVLLRTEDTAYVKNLGITSHKSLLEYGVRIEGNMLLLAAAWGEGVNKGGFWEYTLDVDGHKLTLQTTLPKDQIGVLPESATSADAVAEDQADAPAMAAASTDLSRDDLDGPGADSAEDAPEALNEGLNTLSALDATPEAHEQTVAMNARAAAADRHEAVSGNADAPVSAGGEADGGTAVDGDLNAFLAQVESLGGDRGDALIFGNGDDVIAGTEGRDFIYAGDGDDLIVYDPTDYLIEGGEGIDFLLAGAASDASLGALLTNDSADNGPLVNGVEVLLKGENLDDIANLGDLKALGISMGEDGKSLTLDSAWRQEASKTFGEGDGKVTVTTWKNGDVTLETTLQSVSSEAEVEQAVQTLVLTSNG